MPSIQPDLKGEYTGSDFSLLDVFMNEKGPSAKIQLLNIFNDHHIVAKLDPTAVAYDEWLLYSALWMKFYNGHGNAITK